MRFPNNEFYLKSEEEIRRIFSSIPEACDNTAKIAEQCNVTFEFGKLHLPEFIPPEGFDNPGYLRHLCEKGLVERYIEPDDAIWQRLNYEISSCARKHLTPSSKSCALPSTPKNSVAGPSRRAVISACF